MVNDSGAASKKPGVRNVVHKVDILGYFAIIQGIAKASRATTYDRSDSYRRNSLKNQIRGCRGVINRDGAKADIYWGWAVFQELGEFCGRDVGGVGKVVEKA